MLLDQRRGDILELVESKGFVNLQELDEHVGVSESTVRRDLEYLERSGHVRRTRGGAAYAGESLVGYEDRRGKNQLQKQKIARAVASLIEDEETILLDGGTTTLEVARQLQGKRLQVVTNSLPILNLLVADPRIELIYLGGYLYPKTGVALGELTIAALGRIHARRLVMSVGGVTEAGLFNSNSLLVEAERKMLDVVDEVIVAADSTKFGHLEFAHLCPLQAVDRFVVDDGLSPEWREHLLQLQIPLTVAD
jgi:DeoR/GlpR family transcriptional regulator of sugar metabolism